MSTTYRARIIRADDSGLWVSVPALGDAEFGPLESIVSDIIIKPKYMVGDRVIIEQIGSIPEDFIVVGIAARTIGAPPDWSLRNIDASQVVSGVLEPGRIPNLDASKVTSGVLDPARIPLIKAIDYKIDILYNDPNPITMLRSVPGTNHSGGAVVISPQEFGAVFNSDWKVRFDSSGTMTHGLIPNDHLTGSAGSINPWFVPGYNRDPNGGDSWWTTDREGNWDAGTRMVFHNYAVAHNWHFGFWNANGDEELLVGHDGQRYFRASGIYGRTTTAGANVVIGWWGDLSRSTSLRAAKAAIEDAPQNWAEKVWDLQPRTWIDKGDAERLADALSRETEGEEVDWSDTMVAPLRRIPGFVAEEVEEAGLEEFLVRDESGALTGLAYDRFSAALLVAMKDERQKRIDLEARVGTLVSRIEALEGGVEA